jgi:hypothetical protein
MAPTTLTTSRTAHSLAGPCRLRPSITGNEETRTCGCFWRSRRRPSRAAPSQYPCGHSLMRDAAPCPCMAPTPTPRAERRTALPVRAASAHALQATTKRALEVVLGFHVGALLEQHLHALHVAIRRCEMQRRVPAWRRHAQPRAERRTALPVRAAFAPCPCMAKTCCRGLHGCAPAHIPGNPFHRMLIQIVESVTPPITICGARHSHSRRLRLTPRQTHPLRPFWPFTPAPFASSDLRRSVLPSRAASQSAAVLHRRGQNPRALLHGIHLALKPLSTCANETRTAGYPPSSVSAMISVGPI